MSDEYGSDEPVEVPQQQAPVPDAKEAYWEAEAKKAFQARDQARADLRSQIQAGYDPEVVELVPENLPPQEWKAHADKLVAFKGQASSEPAAPREPVEQVEPETPTEAEAQLAAVNKGPSQSAAAPSGFTQDELMQIAMTDPERYTKLKESGVSLQKLGDDPKHFGPDR